MKYAVGQLMKFSWIKNSAPLSRTIQVTTRRHTPKPGSRAAKSAAACFSERRLMLRITIRAASATNPGIPVSIFVSKAAADAKPDPIIQAGR
jgi:hypothetical protein